MVYESPTTMNMSKGMGEIFGYLSDVTNYWFGNMLLISIYVIILIGSFKTSDDFAGAMAIAGFGTFVIGLLFWLGGMVSGWAFGVAVAMAIVGAMILWGSKN